MYGQERGGSGGGAVGYASNDGGYEVAGGRYGGGGGRGRGGGYDDNSQNRGGDYQGDRSGGRGGGGGSGRDGDWRCPNPSCGNLNFAKRDKCNKCGALPPAGSGDHGNRGNGSNGRGGSYGSYGNNRGGRGDSYTGGNGGGNRDGGPYRHGRDDNSNGQGRNGGSGQNRNQGGYGQNRKDSGYGHGNDNGVYGQGSDIGGHSQGMDGFSYGQVPSNDPSYGNRPGGNYPSQTNAYSGNTTYPSDAVPPPASYTGGPSAYPPSYGDSESHSDVRCGHGGPAGGYDNNYGGVPRNTMGSYGDTQAEALVKQCDKNCGESCDNARIYISNLPPDVTIEELRDLFGSIGQVARIKQKRGYKDQWPWSIKLYTDEQGINKGDAVLSYEDPSAAHSAGGFFDITDYELRGYKIKVGMAEKSAPKAGTPYGSGGGARGGYGSDRRRDSYRDGGGSGPDRNDHGGKRSRPY